MKTDTKLTIVFSNFLLITSIINIIKVSQAGHGIPPLCIEQTVVYLTLMQFTVDQSWKYFSSVTLKVLNFMGIKFRDFRDFGPFLQNFVRTKSFKATKSQN